MTPETAFKKYMAMPLSDVMEIADKEFQKMRRMECADEYGMIQCICCPKSPKKHYSTVDAGHFIPRKHYGTRYLPDNVWAQRKHCNDYRGGNHAEFRDELTKKLGWERIEEMERNKDVTPQPWKEFVISIIVSSRKRIKELKKGGL